MSREFNELLQAATAVLDARDADDARRSPSPVELDKALRELSRLVSRLSAD